MMLMARVRTRRRAQTTQNDERNGIAGSGRLPAGPLAERRIRLAVISQNAELRRRVIAQADPLYFEFVEHGVLEELRVPPEGDEMPVVVVIAQPGDPAARHKSAVVAIGIQDVIKIENLTSIRVRDAALASFARERRLQELKLERNRAVIQAEVGAGLTNARSGLEVLETLADGLVALGASAVSCWRVRSETLELVVARGGSDRRTVVDDLTQGDHPARQALERNETVVSRGTELQLHVPLVGASGVPWVVRITTDETPSEARAVSLEQVVRQAAEALERVRLREELDAQRQRMRALVDSLQKRADAPDAAALLEDALHSVAPTELQVEAIDLRSLLAEAGFEAIGQAALEIRGDRAAIGRALRALRRTLTPYVATSGALAAHVNGDDHAAYVEARNVDDGEATLGGEPGLDLVRGVCAAHGGHAWVEGSAHERRVCLQLPRAPRLRRPPTLSLNATPSRGSGDDDLEHHLETLRNAFASPHLGSLLDLWADARRGAPLPHPDRIRGAGLVALRPDMAEARVSYDQALEPNLAWTMLGARLERRLGGTLVGQVADASSRELLADLVMQYRRCAREARPTYDYLRQRGEAKWSFERLLLPCSRDASNRPSDILALVLFDGIDHGH